jgi:RimJ/RimL family protein N-acetyltransferase
MFARTERLLLRPGWMDDAPALQAAIAHEEVARNLAKLPWPYSIKDAQSYLGQNRGAEDANLLVFARTEEALQLIGGVCLQLDEDGETEIGYWIAPRYWGFGFATEAAAAVVRLARHGLRLPRLVSGHFADNPASGEVLQKIGFKPTGRIVNRMSMARGREVPCVLYAMDTLTSTKANRSLTA